MSPGWPPAGRYQLWLSIPPRLVRRWQLGKLREVRRELEAGVLRRLALKELHEEPGGRQPGEA